uniref:Apple domain-containing protein n=1 Tax=Pyrodinium bahamense TaxID=73915 RepID=A0A7S0FTU6_9DINO
MDAAFRAEQQDSQVTRGRGYSVVLDVPSRPLQGPESEGRRPGNGCQRRAGAAALAALLATSAVLGTAAWQSRGQEQLRQQIGESNSFEQKWAWGTCKHMGKDVAYFFRKPLKNYLNHIATAEQCCTYCQSTPKCKSWTWVQHLGRCYMEDTPPVKNISKKGYWSGMAASHTTPAPRMRGQWGGASPGSRGDGSSTPPPAKRARTAPAASQARPMAAGVPGSAPSPAKNTVTSRAVLSMGSSMSGLGSAVKGGAATQAAFTGFLAIWRDSYKINDGSVPEVVDASLPSAFKGIPTKVVVSSGGAAGGVVTEGMGYGIMVEAFKAVAGDKTGLANGIALLRGWLGMVYGPAHTPHPFGGGTERGGATHANTYPYGVSAIAGKGLGGTPSGVAGWKYPINQCYPVCQGSATDGDEDAVLGMIYLSAALGNPKDFVDMAIRAVIAFASADLGFPDLYRTLPDGTRIFVPKGGSQWGGLLPEQGEFKSSQQAWCYNPSYFAPGHYRVFRDYTKKHWKSSFDSYLPPHLDGTRTSVADLTAAFNGAIIAGYNILYYSSCSSGAVGNPEESTRVTMYNRAGAADPAIVFNAKVYLNRMANQYKNHARCDAARGDCHAVGSTRTETFKLSVAFDQGPHMTCHNVPNAAQSWWAAFMAWPTFTAFVAPLEPLSASDSAAWLDALASNCEFTGKALLGSVCSSSYFELGQEVISTMVMAGAVVPLKEAAQAEPQLVFK